MKHMIGAMMMVIFGLHSTVSTMRTVLMPFRTGIIVVLEHHIPVTMRRRNACLMPAMQCSHRDDGRREHSGNNCQISQQQYPPDKPAREGSCWVKRHGIGKRTGWSGEAMWPGTRTAKREFRRFDSGNE